MAETCNWGNETKWVKPENSQRMLWREKKITDFLHLGNHPLKAGKR